MNLLHARTKMRQPYVVDALTRRRQALRRLGVLSKGDMVLWSGDARVPPPVPEDYLGKVMRFDHDSGCALVQFARLRVGSGGGYVTGAPTDTVKVWVLLHQLRGAPLDD